MYGGYLPFFPLCLLSIINKNLQKLKKIILNRTRQICHFPLFAFSLKGGKFAIFHKKAKTGNK